MEKEDSTEKKPVDSPAPDNVKKVDSPETQDHENNNSTKKELSDGEKVGTSTIDTHEEHLDSEPSTTDHLLDKEHDKTASDDQEVETSSKSKLEVAANDMEVRGQKENISTDNTTSTSSVLPSNALTSEPDTQKEDQEKGKSLNDTTINSTASDIEIREDKSTNSLSNSESSVNTLPNQEKGNSVNNTTVTSTPSDIEIRGQEEDNSTNKSLSNSESSINLPEKDIQKEDQEKGTSVNNTTINSSASDIEIKGQEEDNSTNKSLLDSENSVNTLPKKDIQKEDQEKGKSVNNTTINSTASDIEMRGQEEGNSTENSLSNSKNLNDTLSGEPDIQKENQEKGNSVNNTTISSTASDIEIRSQEEDNSTNRSLSNSENSINTLPKEDIQKEDQEKGNSVNNTTNNSTASDIEIRGQEEDNSTNNSVSNSENSINTLPKEDIQKEDQEKGNSVNIPTVNSTTSDIKITGQEEDNSTNNSVSNSENSINTLPEKDIQKEDQDKGNSVNNTTITSTPSDIETRGQKEDNSTNKSLSNPENSINTLNGEQDTQKEDQEKGNSVNDTTSSSMDKDGEKLDNTKDKEDEEHSTETVKVNHQSPEKMEMETQNVQEESSHVISTDDGEKTGNDLNNQEGITKDSLPEETGDKKLDTKDNTSSKKEESLVLYGNRDPKMEANTSNSVITKFVKLKSLYAVSNVFRRLSKKPELQNNSNEKNKNIKEENSHEKESQQVSQTKTLEKNQGSKKEVSLESMETIKMKGRVALYTKLWCKECKEARVFLRKKRLKYFEINIDVYPGRKNELQKFTGSSDVPRVFFNQVLIGGLKELKELDENGKLQEKIEYVTSQGPSPKGPLPPFSGEDDVSSRGSVDELAVIVKKMKESIVVKDRFYKFRRVTNCFLGSEAVDFLSQDQFLEREEAVEFARKLAKELFFRHVLEENTFEDGNHLYRFLDQDPVISQCKNIPRGIIQNKRQPLVELSHRLRFLLYAILEAYISEDGKHVSYRTIHGSEEFARFLRIAEELQRVDINRTAKEERLAFFINLYNLMAIHAILVWGHPEGAMDRRKLFNEFKYVIGGCAYSLSDIYNGILRANQRPPYTLIKPFGINDKRFKVSLPYPEPLIHFALVSGSRSAPALRCYSPKNIDVELMEAAHDFLESGAFVLQLDSMTISVTKILKWYSVDFGKNEKEVLKHAANYLEGEKIQNLLELLNNSQLKVVYQPYDWRLNSWHLLL